MGNFWRLGWFKFFFCSPRLLNPIYSNPVFKIFPVTKLNKCRTKGPSIIYCFRIVSPLFLPMISLFISLYRHVCICVCVCIYIYIYIYTHTHTDIYIYIYIYIYICIYTFSYIYIYVCVCVCVCTPTHIYIYIYIYTHTVIYIYIYIYIHTHAHTHIYIYIYIYIYTDLCVVLQMDTTNWFQIIDEVVFNLFCAHAYGKAMNLSLFSQTMGK